MCLLVSDKVCIAVILTVSTIRSSDQNGGLSNTSERQSWYERSLNLWNQDNTIRDHIVVVENSNMKNYPAASHLEFIRFKHSVAYEKKHCNRPTKAMGEHELISILEGMSKAKRIKGATHIVKITGRYYIPGIAHLLKNVSNSDKIVHMNGYAGGCQVMGCRIDACPYLWKCPYDRFSHCEATVKKRMQTFPTEHRFELPLLHTAYTMSGTARKPIVHLP